MRTLLLSVTALVFAGSAAGCAGVAQDEPAEEHLAEQVSAIQDGETTPRYPFAVGLFSRALGAMCSGALIAPNLVLTARHCIDKAINPPDPADPAGKRVVCGETKFGRDGGPTSVLATTCPDMRSCERYYRSAKLFRTPADAFCGNDLALVLLDSNVPATEATPVVPNVENAARAARSGAAALTAIGYGATDAVGNGSGRRRIRQNIPIHCIPASETSNPSCEAVAADLSDNDFYAGDGTCSGDSGASAFEQESFAAGAPITLGVLSRGEHVGTLCKGSVYTRTDKWRDVIVEAAVEAAQRGGYPLPSWATHHATDTGSARRGSGESE